MPKFLFGWGTIQHSVTIGELSSQETSIIGRNVFVGASATIWGNITVGNNEKIGAGAVVLESIPDNSTGVGVPAKQ